MRVSPFRHPRLSGYLLLPGAFRSLSRLSSALSAKASALCSFCLTCHFPSVGNAGGSFFSSFDVFLFNVYVQGSLIYHRYTRSFMYAVFKVQRYALRFAYLFFLFLTDLGPVSGDEEIRTLDPLLARQVLSQLSYIPIGFLLFFFYWLSGQWA